MLGDEQGKPLKVRSSSALAARSVVSSALPPVAQDKNLPEVILVRKSYPQRKNRASARALPFLSCRCAGFACNTVLSRTGKWKLKSLNKEASDKPLKKAEEAKEQEDYERFLQVRFSLRLLPVVHAGG